MPTSIDWDALQFAANLSVKLAYAPYSNFQVGCAALTTDGRIVTGCNVENASYGLTMCAENTMVGNLFITGGGELKAFICVDSKNNIIMPCGRCRQLLHEHASEELLIQTPKGAMTIKEVLPLAFGREDLN